MDIYIYIYRAQSFHYFVHCVMPRTVLHQQPVYTMSDDASFFVLKLNNLALQTKPEVAEKRNLTGRSKREREES